MAEVQYEVLKVDGYALVEICQQKTHVLRFEVMESSIIQ